MNPLTPEPMLLTVRQTTAALAICPKTLWALTRSGRLPAVHITDRAIRYARADIERFISAAKGGRP